MEEIASCADIQIWERSKLRALEAESAARSWERSKLRTLEAESARSWERSKLRMSKLRTLEAENARSWERSKLRTLEADNARRYLDVRITSNFFHCGACYFSWRLPSTFLCMDLQILWLILVDIWVFSLEPVLFPFLMRP